MKALLLARYKHHERYFSALAKASRFAMRVITLKSLPWLKPTLWQKLFQANTADAVSYHMMSKTRKQADKSPLFWKLYITANQLRAALCYAQFYQLLSTEKPDALVVWNGGTWFFKSAIQAATELGITVFYGENGLLPNTTTLDAKGINYANSLPRDPTFYHALTHYRSDFSSNLQPRHSARSLSAQAITLPACYIFVPFQVNTDSQIILNSPWIPDMYRLLDILIAAAQQMQDQEIVFVLKEHPSCKSDYQVFHQSLGKRFLFANGNNMQELIENAECVITINSTAGIESLLLGKKVIVAGNAFYAIPELVLPVHSTHELVQALNTIPSWQPDALLRQKFLTYLSDVYCIPGNREQVDAAHITAVETRINNVVAKGLVL
jgi:capsular polysaccharide export protein